MKGMKRYFEIDGSSYDHYKIDNNNYKPKFESKYSYIPEEPLESELVQSECRLNDNLELDEPFPREFLSSAIDDKDSNQAKKKIKTNINTASSLYSGKAPSINRFSKEISKNSNLDFGDQVENDETRLSTRNKQIYFGKNTIGYDNYLSAVPKNKRKGLKEHPRTPDPNQKVSKRCFDGLIKAWRRKLHEWDNVDKLGSLDQNENNEQLKNPFLDNHSNYNNIKREEIDPIIETTIDTSATVQSNDDDDIL